MVRLRSQPLTLLLSSLLLAALPPLARAAGAGVDLGGTCAKRVSDDEYTATPKCLEKLKAKHPGLMDAWAATPEVKGGKLAAYKLVRAGNAAKAGGEQAAEKGDKHAPAGAAQPKAAAPKDVKGKPALKAPATDDDPQTDDGPDSAEDGDGD
jgi:hypothetical protein